MPLRETVDGPVPSADDIDAVCKSLRELQQQLKRIVRVGGGELNLALLSAAADDCPDAVIISNERAEIRVVNGAAARLTGFSTRELQKLTIWDLTHVSSQGDFDVLWREFLRAGRQRGVYTMRTRRGDALHLAYCAESGVIGDLTVAGVGALTELNVSVLRKPSM
jgi:PAS domain S-box-containing protein